MLKIADREEDGWEVVRCDLSDDLASESEDEKQLSRARREAAANKKKREANKQKDKKMRFRNVPPQKKTPQKVCFTCGQEGHFQYFRPNGRN